jgi:hypothetical protein
MIEAFPNAFLGVLLEDAVYPERFNLKRGYKFKWLLDACREQGVLKRLLLHLECQNVEFGRALSDNDQHDEQAALICALTALCVQQGKYVAVGSLTDGYFFLPPVAFWAAWAKRTFSDNRTRIDEQTCEVWINGERDPAGPASQFREPVGKVPNSGPKSENTGGVATTQPSPPERRRERGVLTEEAIILKHPHAIRGTLHMDKKKNKQMVSIRCKFDGCKNVREVFTSDLFQVDVCLDHCKRR